MDQILISCETSRGPAVPAQKGQRRKGELAGRLENEIADIVHSLFGSKMEREKLIILVEEHKAMCEKIIFLQTNI